MNRGGAPALCTSMTRSDTAISAAMNFSGKANRRSSGSSKCRPLQRDALMPGRRESEAATVDLALLDALRIRRWRIGHAGQVDRVDDRVARPPQAGTPLLIATRRDGLKRDQVGLSLKQHLKLIPDSTRSAFLDIPRQEPHSVTLRAITDTTPICRTDAGGAKPSGPRKRAAAPGRLRGLVARITSRIRGTSVLLLQAELPIRSFRAVTNAMVRRRYSPYSAALRANAGTLNSISGRR